MIFQETDDKKEDAQNAATKNKNDSDSEEEEQNNEQKEKGLSNKRKKVTILPIMIFVLICETMLRITAFSPLDFFCLNSYS